MKNHSLLVLGLLAGFSFDSGGANFQRLSREELRDKIRGAWAGQMIGVSYGASTEFRAQSKTFDAEIKPDSLSNAIRQDDLYVEMTFARVMDTIGLNAAPADYGLAFRDSNYSLWHANANARRNLARGIMPPLTGSPRYNLHADDIDFQIEADFIGIMCLYPVPTLELPASGPLPSAAALRQVGAAQLFIDRASSSLPAFRVSDENAATLAKVCRHLDGIPLAIELAAAKLQVLSLEQIEQRLDDRFRLLTGGSRPVLERHQTLRAAIDWSYNLLSEQEQALFRRLAIFVSGWSLQAAEAVCGGDLAPQADILGLLEQLIRKSMIQTEESRGELRF